MPGGWQHSCCCAPCGSGWTRRSKGPTSSTWPTTTALFSRMCLRSSSARPGSSVGSGGGDASTAPTVVNRVPATRLLSETASELRSRWAEPVRPQFCRMQFCRMRGRHGAPGVSPVRRPDRPGARRLPAKRGRRCSGTSSQPLGRDRVRGCLLDRRPRDRVPVGNSDSWDRLGRRRRPCVPRPGRSRPHVTEDWSALSLPLSRLQQEPRSPRGADRPPNGPRPDGAPIDHTRGTPGGRPNGSTLSAGRHRPRRSPPCCGLSFQSRCSSSEA
jgi:hypothetical protein